MVSSQLSHGAPSQQTFVLAMGEFSPYANLHRWLPSIDRRSTKRLRVSCLQSQNYINALVDDWIKQRMPTSQTCFSVPSRPFVRFFSLLAILALLVVYNSIPAAAQGFDIRPQTGNSSYFKLTIAPGETIQDGLTIVNPGDAPQQIKVQAVRAATMAAGGLSYPDAFDGAAQWVTFEDPAGYQPAAGRLMSLPAQSSATLPFTVRVPENTTPGEYVVGIVAMPHVDPEAAATLDVEPENTDDENTGTFQVQVVTRRAMAMVITVPGETRCAASLTGIETTVVNGRWRLLLGMENAGNVHFRGEGDLVVYPADGGTPIVETPFQVGYFIPGDSIEYRLTPGIRPPEGDYHAEATFVTDCGYATALNQPVGLSREQVNEITVAPEAGTAPAVDPEAARLQAQAEWIRAIGFLLGGIAAVVLVIVLSILGVVWFLRKRKLQATTPPVSPPRRNPSPDGPHTNRPPTKPVHYFKTGGVAGK